MATPLVRRFEPLLEDCHALHLRKVVRREHEHVGVVVAARELGDFKTSMLQDLESGRALEIDGLLAGTLEIARKAAVAAPNTESVLGLIRVRAQATGQYRRAA